MQNASSPSLAARAVLAVVLLVGFYLLALAVAAGLLWIPYAEWRYLDHVSVKIALFCVVGAALVLWGIVPRPDRFDPPGPRLAPDEHPRLFALIREVAAATGQAMPAEVYLVPDLNAWVAQRGGVMGLGSRRVMGLGLPLLQTLSSRELRAVLAHEFGHYHGGDTALGPWIYKTRAAIGRTLQALAGHSTVLMKPFEWYGLGFLRITHAISRRQEFVADALAARVAGSDAMISGLKAVHGAGNAFHPYWLTEYAPVLERGFRAPLTQGFAAFLASPEVVRGVRESLEAELASPRSDPYDTHPPLRERIAALAGLPAGAPGDGGARALDLLDDVERCERELVQWLLDGRAASLQPLAWEDAAERVWIPTWREQAAENAKRLRGITPESVADQADPPTWAPLRMGFAASPSLLTDEHRSAAAGILGCALLTAFHAAGAPIQAPVGAPVTVEVDGTVVRPFQLLRDLAAGTVTRDAWREVCRRSGIAGVDLGSPVPAPAAAV
ncbi:MAG TPA: M48 family metallopeptidase [Longimicrobium sp.]|jgi:Zn-dependent protease with chaperone function